MLNAILAGTIIAITCGIMSIFVIMRKAAFAAHSLSHISLTGASAAALIGISTLTGQLVANFIAAVIIGFLSNKIKKNDLSISFVLTFFLGIGAYFLFLCQKNNPNHITTILFGNILTVSTHEIYTLITLAIIVIITITTIARILFFESIDPVLAKAKKFQIGLSQSYFSRC